MRYMKTKAGTAHIAGLPDSLCPVVRRAARTGEWKGIRSLKPEQVLELKDCSKCQSHKAAKSELKPKPKPPKRAAFNSKQAVAERLRRQPVPGDKGEIAANEHAKLATEHGWHVEVMPGRDEWVVVATKGDEMVQVAWVNGKVDYPRVIAVFPSYTFWLKNTTQWRRQVSLPEGERPAPREPKRSRKPRTESKTEPRVINGTSVEEDPQKLFKTTSLPFASDDEDFVIIDALKGHELFWRNNMAAKVNRATVPMNTRLIRVAVSPKSGRRFVSFPEAHGYDSVAAREVLGAERSVAIEDMIKVG
jgi:hypothetical protein